MPMSPQQPLVDDDEALDDETSSPTDAAEAGYMIGIKVRPDGLSVCRLPLPPESAPGEKPAAYEETPVTSLEEALKTAVKMHRANPVGEDQQAAFTAGFGGMSEPPASSAPREPRGGIGGRY